MGEEGKYFMSKATKSLQWNRTVRALEKKRRLDMYYMTPRERLKEKQNHPIYSDMSRMPRPPRPKLDV